MEAPKAIIVTNNLGLCDNDVVQLKNEASSLRRILLSNRQLCDTELLLNGGFAPLTSFMNEDDYNR